MKKVKSKQIVQKETESRIPVKPIRTLEEIELIEVKVKEISALIDQIRPTLVEAGIPNSNIVFKGDKLKSSTPEILDFAIRWLKIFLQAYCVLIPKARKLVPDHVWENYKVLGVTGTYEQEQLIIARKIVREQWGIRPNCLKRKPNSGKRKAN